MDALWMIYFFVTQAVQLKPLFMDVLYKIFEKNNEEGGCIFMFIGD